MKSDEDTSRSGEYYFPIGMLGAIGEFDVVLDLLSRGYEVYKACNPSAPYDLIIDNGSELLKVEVKMNTDLKSRQKEYLINADILAVVVNRGQIIYRPDLSEAVKDRAIRPPGIQTELRKWALDRKRSRKERLEEVKERKRIRAERVATTKIVERERTDKCVELRMAGWALEAIGKEVGLTVAMVHYILTKYEGSEGGELLPRCKRGRKSKDPIVVNEDNHNWLAF